MTNYTKTTDFAAKDSLPSGDSGKIIRGSEFETEFDNIATAVNSKSDANNPTFTGTVTIDGLTVNGNTILGNAATDTVTVTADIASNLLPSADDTYNLGAVGAEWNDLHVDGVAYIDTIAGFATTENITFGDNDKAIFGAGSDLQIFHDGSNSRIHDTGTGNLILRGTNLSLQDSSGFDYITAVDNGDGGTVRLFHNNSEKLETTTTGIDVTGVITTDGMTTSADINFGDNDKAVFGAGSDLEIYSDGGSGIIQQVGTGVLLLKGQDFYVQNDAGSNYIRAEASAQVDLYYGGVKKFETTSSGIDVTGTAAVDVLDVSGSGASISSNSANGLQIGGDAAGSTLIGNLKNTSGRLTLQSTTSRNVAIQTNGATDRILVSSGGDVSFYEDTGTTAKFRWDAADERLGIGTSSPAKTLHVVDTSNGNTTTPVLFQNSGGLGSAVELRLVPTPYPNEIGSTARWSAIRAINSDAGNATDLAFLTNDISADPTERVRIDHDGNVGIGTDSPSVALEVDGTIKASGNGKLQIADDTEGSTFEFNVGGGGALEIYDESAERMRIDSSGNVLVGGTDAFPGDGDTNTGISLTASGSAAFSRDGFRVVSVNRNTSDGTLIEFNKGGVEVGSISVTSSATAFNTSSDQRLKDNIVDAPSASDDIDAIQVRSFDWKADGSHQKYGMVAQELQTVTPEAVTEGETEEDMMGVDYSKLVPMMLKEIQSLRARVAQLEGVN